MAVPLTHEDYLNAARVLWGDAGEFIVSEYDRLNREHFRGQLPPVPMVIGMTPYGRCIGLTRASGPWTGRTPRITIASNLFEIGSAAVSDVVLHEMIHVKLQLAGEDSSHNSVGWCGELERLSPAVLGYPVQAAPVLPRRVDGKVARAPLDGHLTRKELASWPGLRPGGERFDVPTA